MRAAMAQTKNRPSQQAGRTEEIPSVVDATPVERDLPHMRFAFGVWMVVFSLLALSILWDSIFGLLFRSPPSVAG
jgi:hypothetical protein